MDYDQHKQADERAAWEREIEALRLRVNLLEARLVAMREQLTDMQEKMG